MNGKTIRTFLGANTPNGFFSYSEPFIKNKKAYIIKGGPGTGKSSFMKKIAGEAVNQDFFTEYAYCSSDYESLDGVLIPELNLAFADGTPPHVLEPEIPGVLGGILNLSEFWDEKKLAAASDDIRDLKNRISKSFDRCTHYLSAAGSIREDISQTTMEHLQKEKADRYLKNLCAKNFPAKRPQKGKVHKRFLSAFTENGIVCFKDTVYTLCDRVLVLRDDYFISGYFIEKILAAAERCCGEVYAFYSPFSPETPEHIAIPEIGLAVVTSSRSQTFRPEKTKGINLSRFIGDDIYFSAKRLAFAKKVMAMCVEEACAALKAEKAYHDDLEEFYISAMNFSLADQLCEKTISNLLPKKNGEEA